MPVQLSFNETRVLGVLFEKEVTTPEQYPLSLNALTNACNQKSNREPVTGLEDSVVQETVDDLIKKNLVAEAQSGGRVVKYKHRFCNTEFGKLKLSEQELAIIGLLFLRGPQTPGELRTRSNRLCRFGDVSEVESVLLELTRRDDGPFVLRLPRQPGKRESRYAHLFSGDVDLAMQSSASTIVSAPSADQQHSNDLEERVRTLESQVAALMTELGELKKELGE